MASRKKRSTPTASIVAPGFVDLHTHYDAQIRWDPYCTISGWHGVTSVVLGNCGFGFCPVKPEVRERSMLTMTRTEAIPYESMKHGMTWDWETIPQYLDSLNRAPKGVNAIQYLPTSSLMIYVMGIEAAKSRPATEAERDEMRRLLAEGMDAGLSGFSIQRLGPDSTQADFDGSPMVTDMMCDEDILNLARVLRERDEGFIQITQATGNIKDDLAFLERLAADGGSPDPAQRDRCPRVRTPSASAQPRMAQALPRKGPADFRPDRHAAHRLRVHAGALESLRCEPGVARGHDRHHAREDPEDEGTRARAGDQARARRGESRNCEAIQAGVGGAIRYLIVQWADDKPELEKYVGKSLGQIAAEETKHEIDVMLDLSIAGDLKVEFLGPNRGFNAEFYRRDDQRLALHDPGRFRRRRAYQVFHRRRLHHRFSRRGWCATNSASRWKKRTTGCRRCPRMRRASATAACCAKARRRTSSSTTSTAWRSSPNGSARSRMIFPGGEWRRVQHARGYRAIVVNGEMTWDDGRCTGATPGSCCVAAAR